jgi:hypothetical protein
MTPRSGLSRRSVRAREGDVGAEGAAAARHIDEFAHEHPVQSGLRRGWWPRWAWLLLTGVVLAAYTVAVLYKGEGSLGQRLIDSLKIFPSAFPGYDTSEPWQYNLARYAAAAVFLLGSMRILAALFAERFAEARAAGPARPRAQRGTHRSGSQLRVRRTV